MSGDGMKAALFKNILREIKGSLGRYLAILGIIALGSGFLMGLRVTKTAMLETTDRYLRQHNFFDYRIVSTLGMTKDDVAAFAAMPDVEAAEGAVALDALFLGDGEKESMLKVHTITETVNTLSLAVGRMPQSPNECVVDALHYPETAIGETLKVSPNNEESARDTLLYEEYEIVGLVHSPYYLNYERGSTSLGDGTVLAFVYIPLEGLQREVYTEVDLMLKGEAFLYSQEYEDCIEATQDEIEKMADLRAEKRYQQIVSEAREEIDKGQAEYDEGLAEYVEKKAEAEAELAAALLELQASQRELSSARGKVKQNQDALAAAQNELDAAKAAWEQNCAQVDEQFTALYAQVDGQRAQLEQNRAEAQQQLNAIAGMGLVEQEQQLNALLLQIEGGLAAAAEARLEVEAQEAQARQQLQAAEAELLAMQQQIDEGNAELARAKNQIGEGRRELEEGYAAYYEAEKEAQKEFSDAEAELDSAHEALLEARQEVRELERADVYVFDRETNTGYVCMRSDSDITEGVSKVFPIFFFLVAALICITTITRMVDEQRTQLGILRALGYGRAAVIGKFLIYSGSASLIGCLIGIWLGSYFLPKALWQAYSIMYGFGDILFVMDYGLATVVGASYVACALLATWLACKNEMRDMPAALIRQKSPDAGKRVFLEKIGVIWKKLSFLQKVSFRNILRYKKRMVMMIIGIGGCTALIVTGLGLNDSIKDVVNYQFDEITLYDYKVTFEEPMDEAAMEAFARECGSACGSYMLTHESSVDVTANGSSKSANFVVSDVEDSSQFIHLHSESETFTYPKKGEVVLNKKLAKTLAVAKGDSVTLRDSDMNTLELVVAGVCDNYVYNYVFVHAATCVEQWGFVPTYKTALVNTEEENLHGAATAIGKADGVLNVMVNEDIRERVGGMLDSMNYIAAVCILCAGALAFIVLFNLININITERVREIATLKVLGFYRWETASYVIRENFILTIVGALVGLGLGKLLHAFVMSQIQIDLVYFDVRVSPLSYLIAFGLTIVFAGIVDLIMTFKLDRINMADSLKSAE